MTENVHLAKYDAEEGVFEPIADITLEGDDILWIKQHSNMLSEGEKAGVLGVKYSDLESRSSKDGDSG